MLRVPAGRFTASYNDGMDRDVEHIEQVLLQREGLSDKTMAVDEKIPAVLLLSAEPVQREPYHRFSGALMLLEPAHTRDFRGLFRRMPKIADCLAERPEFQLAGDFVSHLKASASSKKCGSAELSV